MDAPEKPATDCFTGCVGVLLGQVNKGQTASSRSAKYQRAAAIHRGASQFIVCLYKHSLLVHVVHTLAAAVQRGNSESIPAVLSATEPLAGAAPSVSDSDSTMAFLRGLPADGPAGGSAAADSFSSFTNVSMASLSFCSASACQAQRSVERVGKARSRSSSGPIRCRLQRRWLMLPQSEECQLRDSQNFSFHNGDSCNCKDRRSCYSVKEISYSDAVTISFLILSLPPAVCKHSSASALSDCSN